MLDYFNDDAYLGTGMYLFSKLRVPWYIYLYKTSDDDDDM